MCCILYIVLQMHIVDYVWALYVPIRIGNNLSHTYTYVRACHNNMCSTVRKINIQHMHLIKFICALSLVCVRIFAEYELYNLKIVR